MNQMLIDSILKEEIGSEVFLAHYNVFSYEGTNWTHLDSNFFLIVLQICTFALKPAADNANKM